MWRGVFYEAEIRHRGLERYRYLRGRERCIVERKARLQLAAWDAQWRRRIDARAADLLRQRAARRPEQKIALALQRTREARMVQQALHGILAHTLALRGTIQWKRLKGREPFPMPRPAPPLPPAHAAAPRSADFRPPGRLIDRILPPLGRFRTARASSALHAARNHWRIQEVALETRYQMALRAYAREIRAWERERGLFAAGQSRCNAAIDAQKRRYLNNDPDAIEEYCDLVLSLSDYPDFMPREFEVAYAAASRLLAVDYRLPSLDDLPALKAVTYVQRRDALVEIHLDPDELAELHERLLPQICLRSLRELCETDVVDALESILFNGWIGRTDTAGNKTRACVISVQMTKAAVLDIDLARVDAKAFLERHTALDACYPGVQPVRIRRADPRYIKAQAVAHRLDETTNLAEIDWQEFEQLIREIFEREFSTAGGEVRATRAARDGGVDVIAFDPDPIRGGKIIIQAKRYTNVVGVAAVRDLYGAVVSEGASKGILITTASFGPDAYRFAEGKPISLLHGGDLLRLLGQHGCQARIDLAEAKRRARQAAARCT